jgi:hypothetical protein
VRRAIQAATFVIGLIGLAVACWLLIVGGFDLTLFHTRVSAHTPWRPAVAALIALVIFVAAGGRPAFLWSGLRSLDHLDDRWIAAALAVAICVVGIAYATTVAGGADSYGYVSEADLWLTGHLKSPQTWAQDAPWPSRRWSFAPLGYLPGSTDEDGLSLVPVYSPGLPLLMAGAKLIGGQEGMFWVVPILGGLLVLATFGIGRRLGASRAGLVGAFLTATSPVVLFMLVAPMTDVAVAGAWMVAFYFLLGESRGSALAAGVATAIAVLIRPNLSFEAGVLGLWYLLRAWRSGEWRREILRACLFGAGVAPGVAALAAINTYLYGSPFVSGYGTFAQQFYLSRVPLNATLYTTWFMYAHTPIALVGLIPLTLPLKWLWPAVKDRLIFVVIGAFMSLIFLEFFAYSVFDAWWYLRFIIPCLPFIMLGVGAVVTAVARMGKPAVTLVVVGLVAVLCVRNFRVAVHESAFDLWRGDLRYVAVAKLARRMTNRNSVIYAMQHSGSLRYYGGRLTVRYDIIDRDWLDSSVEWFESRGVHPYLVLEDWEIQPFKQRFVGAKALALLDSPPLLTYEGGARILLYDLATTRNPAATPWNVVETYADRLRSTRPVLASPVTFPR